MQNYIVDATFVSVWDGGYAVETPCKVNLSTHQVFDIQQNESAADFVETLDKEYIQFVHGSQAAVFRKDDERLGKDDFWYE